MKIRTFTFAFILFSLILAACSSGDTNQNDGWQNYQNDELGISFELPETWVMLEGNGIVTIAIDQEALDNEISTGAGASIALATSRDFDGYNEPRDILGLFMDYFEYSRDDLKKINEPEFITIQDQPTGTVAYRGTVREQTGLFNITIITNGDHIALVLTIDGSEDEQHQEELERITQSILVYPPSE